jgi:hypothetical protein
MAANSRFRVVIARCCSVDSSQHPISKLPRAQESRPLSTPAIISEVALKTHPTTLQSDLPTVSAHRRQIEAADGKFSD